MEMNNSFSFCELYMKECSGEERGDIESVPLILQNAV